MSEVFEARQGQGISLLINSDSNYGLTSFKPLSPEHPRYELNQKKKALYEEQLKELGYISFTNSSGIEKRFYGKKAEAILKCLFDCAAEKINNYERYCSCCKDYYKNIKEEEH